MEYKPNKEIIARRVAAFFNSGDLVNLGIGLPTEVANYIPPEVEVLFHSENGMVGTGPLAKPGEEDPALTNAGGQPVTILPGGAFFDSAVSFGIIRGGHLDYTVLGVLEVDQEGNLANYKVPGKLVPGMGGAMDLTTGAKQVIAATLHFDRSGASKLKRRCTLPLTAAGEVDYVVTDLGLFGVREGTFVLEECFSPYDPQLVVVTTDADVVVSPECRRHAVD